jgi:hypothetical protein
MIRHLWLDFSDTIVFINKEEHDKLRYESYASVIGKQITPELEAEYENLYEKTSTVTLLFSNPWECLLDIGRKGSIQ